jgi:predicted tellurium resistance membrane protein TerC
MEGLLSLEALIALVTLTAMEIVLGIDNIIFILITTGKLLPQQQKPARTVGLALALGMRLLLLLTISFIMGLTAPLFTILRWEFSGRDLILLGGGLFLIYKATFELHERLEVRHAEEGREGGGQTFWLAIAQIILMDVVFSLDSVITAIGMSNQIPVMVAAMVIAVVAMMVSAGPLNDFVERHPTIRILALAFLLLIGVMLVLEGTGQHINKGYIYFAMAFSVFVELLNMRVRRVTEPVALHHPYRLPASGGGASIPRES